MKRVSVFASLFVLVFVTNHVYGTISEFFDSLPAEISKSFSSAWNTVVTAVKRPMRIRRLGTGRKRKTTPATTTLSTTTVELHTTGGPVYSSIGKLKLPILPVPKWKSLEDWENIQKPRLEVQGLRKSWRPSTKPWNDELPPVVNDLAKLADEDNFGPLLFV